MDIVTCEYCGVTPPKSYIIRSRYICKPCTDHFINNKPIQLPCDVHGGGEYASEETTSMGTQAEKAFVKYCQDHNFRLRPATKYENTVLHYDYVVELQRQQVYLRVEVKSIKSRRRGLPPDPRVIFVELRDIHGNPGWLYGASDMVAFQQPDNFIFIKRQDLLRVVEQIRPQCRVALQSGIHHTLYSRANRHDLLLVLDTDDIKNSCVNLQ